MNMNKILEFLLHLFTNERGIFNLGIGADAKARMVTYLPAAHFEVADQSFSSGTGRTTAATSSTGDCLVNCNWFRAVVLQKLFTAGAVTGNLQTATAGPIYYLECSDVADFSGPRRIVGQAQMKRENVLQTREIIGVSATDNQDFAGQAATNNTNRGQQPGHRFVRIVVDGFGADSGSFDVMFDAG